jgi:restriction system protein
MEPNESTQGRTGEKIAFSGEYRAACCHAVKKLSQGDTFPDCSEHGETVWSWIPPFVQSDYGTGALLEQWRRIQSKRFSDTLGLQDAVSLKVVSSAETTPFEALAQVSASARVSAQGEVEPEGKPLPIIVIQAAIIVPGNKVSEGVMIEAVGPAWFEILRQLERDPAFLYGFSKYDRAFEELIAGAYKADGWPEVVLTRRSNDKGRDIIASKPGFCSVRFIDQVKAYAPDHSVTANDVRALLGVLLAEQNVSKGVVTTTSQFAPGIEKDENIKRLMPFRLGLRNGKDLCKWLSKLYKTNS